MNRLDTLLDFYREDPEDAFTIFALASEYGKIGDTVNARKYFETLVSEKPEYVGTYYHLGKLYETLELWSDALATYTSGIEVASRIRDHHSRSELQSAKMNLELVLDE